MRGEIKRKRIRPPKIIFVLSNIQNRMAEDSFSTNTMLRLKIHFGAYMNEICYGSAGKIESFTDYFRMRNITRRYPNQEDC